MIYVIEYNNEVISGSRHSWDRRHINEDIAKAGGTARAPKEAPTSLPLVLDDNTRIIAAAPVAPSFNGRVQKQLGFTWTVTNDVAVNVYHYEDLSLEEAKANLLMELEYAEVENKAAHEAAINNLTTLQEVAEYDLTLITE